MSEYQYYEFQAIDTPLTEKQMDTLRSISSRAEITPTRFTNHYNYGDFKGDPRKLMRKFFDAHVYVANWGSAELHLRIPLEFLQKRGIRPTFMPSGVPERDMTRRAP